MLALVAAATEAVNVARGACVSSARTVACERAQRVGTDTVVQAGRGCALVDVGAVATRQPRACVGVAAWARVQTLEVGQVRIVGAHGACCCTRANADGLADTAVGRAWGLAVGTSEAAGAGASVAR